MTSCEPKPISLHAVRRPWSLRTAEAIDQIKRWHPQREHSRLEQFLMKRLTRTRKLFGFLREDGTSMSDAEAAGPAGRARFRQRVAIEHRLAHISQRQGGRARCLGPRKTRFDLRRSATVLNLETIHRLEAASAA